MRNSLLIIISTAAFVLASPLLAQEKHEVTVTSIVVPVRVMDGDNFVENLTVEDFDVLENLVPQKIQALYLVKKADIQRQQGAQEFNPAVSRSFFLLFQLTEYNPKLSDLIDYLFRQVLLPADTMVIQTPMKSYSLSPQALARKSKEELAEEMNSLLKKDIKTGNTEYNSLLNDLKRIVRNISGTTMRGDIESDSATSTSGLEFMLTRYKDAVARMEEQRLIDERKIFRFAQALKRVEGQKNVFFIYQREFRPEIQTVVLNSLLDSYQDQPNVMSDLQDMFQFYSRDLSVNAEQLKKAFADASINFNFIFMNKEPENISGIAMREQSEDVYRAFSQVAAATGGIVDTSQNPVSGFKHAIESSEKYYLLYYSPENYQPDGQFKNILVRVKNPNYSVLHRLGYFAN
jgi:VWFA-related protein